MPPKLNSIFIHKQTKISILSQCPLIVHFGFPLLFFLLIFVNDQQPPSFVHGQYDDPNEDVDGIIMDSLDNYEAEEFIGCTLPIKNKIGCEMFAQIDSNGSKNEDKVEEWEPGYRNETERTESGFNGKKIYYAKDGTCGVLQNDTEYGMPELGFPESKAINGIPGSKHKNRCLKDFHNINFGPICGDPNFAYAKHCAMVHFFDNKLPEKSDVLIGDKQDMLLVLIDGCAVCEKKDKQAKQLVLELSVSHVWPAGSIFTGCKEKEKQDGKADGIKFRQVNNARIFANTEFVGAYTSDGFGFGVSFTVPSIFYQRHCQGFFSADEMHKSFTGLKLKVKHNCGDGKEFTVDLPDLETSSYEYHVVEMLGLMLDLVEEKARFMERISRSKIEYSERLRWQNWRQDEDESPQEAEH